MITFLQFPNNKDHHVAIFVLMHSCHVTGIIKFSSWRTLLWHWIL